MSQIALVGCIGLIGLFLPLAMNGACFVLNAGVLHAATAATRATATVQQSPHQRLLCGYAGVVTAAVCEAAGALVAALAGRVWGLCTATRQ